MTDTPLMTGSDLRQIREALDLTQRDMATTLGWSLRKYASRESATEAVMPRYDWLAVLGLWALKGKSLRDLGLR